MGALAGMFGLAGGYGGTGFEGPQQAQLDKGVSQGQVQQGIGQSQQALQQQQGLLNALQQQGGLQNQASVFGQQQALANQLAQGAAGQGPNPAMAQLANTTGQNVANQAALMAGQRGAGANVGLIARNAGMQGAGIQQQAVGQAALQQAQQQIAFQNTLANQQANMANLANTQVGNQIGATGALSQAAQGQQQQLFNAQNAQNLAAIQNVGMTNAFNQAAVTGKLKQQGETFGGLMGGAASATALLAEGGDVSKPVVSQEEAKKFESGFNAALGISSSKKPAPKKMADGGPVSALGKMLTAPMQEGGLVQAKSSGQEAKKDGNSYSNDKIPAMLSEHEIVLPRSVTMSEDPVRSSAEFVARVIAKRKAK